MQGLIFLVHGLGFRVHGLGFDVDGLGFGVHGFRFRVHGLGFRAHAGQRPRRRAGRLGTGGQRAPTPFRPDPRRPAPALEKKPKCKEGEKNAFMAGPVSSRQR